MTLRGRHNRRLSNLCGDPVEACKAVGFAWQPLDLSGSPKMAVKSAWQPLQGPRIHMAAPHGHQICVRTIIIKSVRWPPPCTEEGWRPPPMKASLQWAQNCFCFSLFCFFYILKTLVSFLLFRNTFSLPDKFYFVNPTNNTFKCGPQKEHCLISKTLFKTQNQKHFSKTLLKRPLISILEPKSK
jgi:hypothetical protein